MRETMNFHAAHPGKILKEELASRRLSAASFARLLRVPPRHVQEIAATKRAISPETALRIGDALGTGGRIWLAMQQAYDLRKAEIAMGDRIRAEVQSAACEQGWGFDADLR
jgi:addiction module HigA family antidote